jgi:hypothetical protein
MLRAVGAVVNSRFQMRNHCRHRAFPFFGLVRESLRMVPPTSPERDLEEVLRTCGAETLDGAIPERLLQALQGRETVLSMVRQHVRLGEAHVARQLQIIQILRRGRRDTTRAETLLQIMEGSLQLHQEHLARVLASGS